MLYKTHKKGFYIFQTEGRNNTDIDLTIYFDGNLIKSYHNITNRETELYIEKESPILSEETEIQIDSYIESTCG